MGLSAEIRGWIAVCAVVLATCAVFGAVALAVARQVDEWERIDNRTDLLFCADLAQREPGVWCTNRDGMIGDHDDGG